MLRLIIIILIIVNCLMFYRLLWTESGILSYLQAKEAYNELSSKNQEIFKENKALSREIVNLRNNPDYIMEAIRKETHYVLEDEVIYFFPEKQ
ncbi:MAG: FtsB family cell division protein [Desulfonatronovibrionaceae bacterium]